MALKGGLTAFSAELFWVHSGAELRNSLTKTQSLRNGQRWKVIFDPRFLSAKKRCAFGLITLKTAMEEDLNVEGPLVVVEMSTSTEHTEHIGHSSLVSRLCVFTTCVAHVKFCMCGEAIARKWVLGGTSPRSFDNKRIFSL